MDFTLVSLDLKDKNLSKFLGDSGGQEGLAGYSPMRLNNIYIYIMRCIYRCVYIIRDIYIMTEKAMAPHSSTLAWKIPWTEEPGRLQSTGSLRVGQD